MSAIADEFDAVVDADTQKALLYNVAAFSYMIWNRAIKTTYNERQVIFAELAGAAEAEADGEEERSPRVGCCCRAT